MNKFIEKIEIIGLHDYFDIKQYFLPGINIIYGENGQFKTTLLHILTNASNNQFEKFLYLKFNSISIHMSDGVSVFIKWANEARDKLIISRSDKRVNIAEYTRNSEGSTLSENPLLEAAYFPTFRSILEAWFSYRNDEITLPEKKANNRQEEINSFTKKIFGKFTPDINYLSLPEVIKSINKKVSYSSSLTIKKDQELTAKMASKISEIVIYKSNEYTNHKKSKQKKEATVKEVKSVINKIEQYSIEPFLVLPKTIKEKLIFIEDDQSDLKKNAKIWLFRLSSLYLELLSEELHLIQKSYYEVVSYIKSLNEFLIYKKMSIVSKSSTFFDPCIKLNFMQENSTKEPSVASLENQLSEQLNFYLSDPEETHIEHLSSGERQIATLLYAAFVSSQSLILIDEPEISLHVKWQRSLLKELQKNIDKKQLIICTHSPMIGAAHRESIQGMEISPTDLKKWTYQSQNYLFEEDKSSEENLTEALENYEDKEYYEDN